MLIALEYCVSDASCSIEGSETEEETSELNQQTNKNLNRKLIKALSFLLEKKYGSSLPSENKDSNDHQVANLKKKPHVGQQPLQIQNDK
jgi:hypothetical protein